MPSKTYAIYNNDLAWSSRIRPENRSGECKDFRHFKRRWPPSALTVSAAMRQAAGAHLAILSTPVSRLSQGVRSGPGSHDRSVRVSASLRRRSAGAACASASGGIWYHGRCFPPTIGSPNEVLHRQRRHSGVTAKRSCDDMPALPAVGVSGMKSLDKDLWAAWRNLARHRRRSAVALAAVAFGVVALILAGGFID